LAKAVDIAGDGKSGVPEGGSALRYLARQPILDAKGRVSAYELLFRAGPENVFRGESELASRSVIDDTVMFGLEKLTGGLSAFVNCTADTLLHGDVSVLAPTRTVLEILEHVVVTPELVKACKRLKNVGYRLALDDFNYNPSLDPLIEMADFIKVDFLALDKAARVGLRGKLERFKGALLAEKVESQEEFAQAAGEGYTLFQGYFFCRPVMISHHKVPSNKVAYLNLMKLMQQSPLDVVQISSVVKQDASLTYRLMRLVNSPLYAQRAEVLSIQAALMTVGDDVFRRLMILAIATELNAGRPTEILRMAFARGRWCELVAGAAGQDPTELYLVGLFSLLPAMLQTDMVHSLEGLPRRDEAKAALLGEPSPLRWPLEWLEAHERGEWTNCDAIARGAGMEPELLHVRCTEAIEWADAILSS